MRKVIVLPLDGLESSQALLKRLAKIATEPNMDKLLGFVKLNDGVHNSDAGGPATILEIKKFAKENSLDFGIFLDLKIYDVSETLKNTLTKYLSAGAAPDILTVCAGCSVKGIIELRHLLPDTQLAMISVPTDFDAEECQDRFAAPPGLKIYNDYINISTIYRKRVKSEENKHENPCPFDLIVCSAHELGFLGQNISDNIGFIVPGIRDKWMKKNNESEEHQKRVVGVAQALDLGATYVVMGAQMTKGNPDTETSPEKSRELTLLEITKHFSDETDPLELLKQLDGYYASPTNPDGSFKGPLVGYAGTYDAEGGKKNYVGAQYFNFAKMEEDSIGRYTIAEMLFNAIEEKVTPTLLVGAPMGGIMLAGEIGAQLSIRTIFAEKKVTALADPAQGKKEESVLLIDRHEIYPDDTVVIVEDVCNNFSTTEKLKQLIEEKGGQLVAIACAFNRSGKTDWNGIPVISACFVPTEQFKQDDPKVADLIAADNIAWKPKLEWPRLREAMAV